MCHESVVRRNTIARLFFSCKGRISRRTYWALIGISMVPGILKIVFLVTGDIVTRAFFPGVFYLALPFGCWCLQCAIQIPAFIKRLHDMNRNGWWCILCFFDVLAVIAWIVLGVSNGTQGKNRYGDITERHRLF